MAKTAMQEFEGSLHDSTLRLIGVKQLQSLFVTASTATVSPSAFRVQDESCSLIVITRQSSIMAHISA